MPHPKQARKSSRAIPAQEPFRVLVLYSETLTVTGLT